MKSVLFLTVLTILIPSTINAQPAEAVAILARLKAKITNADNTALLTDVGLNAILQRRVINYLTGVSDLSLARFYASYTADNDKLNLGFNIPTQNSFTQKIHFIINPIVEADVKSNFATLYKDGKWKNNIRAGLKLTWLPGKGKIKFYRSGEAVTNLKILRTKKYAAWKNEQTANYAPVPLVSGSAVTSQSPSQEKWDKKEKELNADVGKAEADYLEKEGGYTKIHNYWFSAWAFTPLSKTEQYVTSDATQPFKKIQFNLWEINLQGTYLYEWRKYGIVYGSLWIRRFQNNSANASLMTNVDYGQYSQLPGANPINLALLETNKAYIGNYSEFMTTNLNAQVVYFFPLYNTLLKPGVSIRYEKNWGDYSPTDLRFGIPLAIQGKDKPINIELQYRLNDISNYKNEANHKTKKTIGISLGFPIVLLYK
jgi:hypothetical protein